MKTNKEITLDDLILFDIFDEEEEDELHTGIKKRK